MKIKSIEVNGLSNKIDARYKFNDDINIITGVNGSGKTTLLKLIWYLISANVERVSPEINYDYVRLETTEYSLELENREGAVKWNFSNSNVDKKGKFYVAAEDIGELGAQEVNSLVISHDANSLFFPTFRRIEGGYSMANTRRIRRRIGSDRFVTEIIDRDDIQSELETVSERLSVRGHKFVCSISTHDIVNLLTKRYALISEGLNEHYKNFSTSIIDSIQSAKSKGKERVEIDSFEILNSIQSKADEINRRREELLKPFDVLSILTAKIFRHKGIRIRTVTLGHSVDAIDSGTLSAGEKQMLSFLCYNAFFSSSIVFIDEPELSLHPDWQRRLFPTLLKQQPSNQFIVATHSPFIYAKYEDKEIVVDENKGE
ncbi:AAA family ATPase [Hahella aquimaris]|uniref:AAA family ATPase n=1 Tax=Hahella sp. HNIBRBA332 TaxID=3015983 RepID=UPI00273C7A1C|nr:ATP-binding protein [Hahella sp. HNIBRBA332]WLQ13551.1 AAA family ATPase [Hahella sp. HNIBRBA332]